MFKIYLNYFLNIHLQMILVLITYSGFTAGDEVSTVGFVMVEQEGEDVYEMKLNLFCQRLLYCIETDHKIRCFNVQNCRIYCCKLQAPWFSGPRCCTNLVHCGWWMLRSSTYEILGMHSVL